MKYRVTITEVHTVVIEAKDAEAAENCAVNGDAFFEIANGIHRTDFGVEVEECDESEDAEFTASDEDSNQ